MCFKECLLDILNGILNEGNSNEYMYPYILSYLALAKFTVFKEVSQRIINREKPTKWVRVYDLEIRVTLLDRKCSGIYSVFKVWITILTKLIN